MLLFAIGFMIVFLLIPVGETISGVKASPPEKKVRNGLIAFFSSAMLVTVFVGIFVAIGISL